LPRYLFKISETIVRGIPRPSSNSRTVNRRFTVIAARTRSTFSVILLLEGLPERGSLSTDYRPSLKRRYHNCIWTSSTESSPKAFLIIRVVSAAECLSLKQNLMQIRSLSTRSIFVNATVTRYTSSLNVFSLPNYYPTGEWLFTHAQ
jgi:hypothetical protein